MPRLLLVDDNPSIHKIAETLLAQTGIELVCTDSAAQALNMVEGGERFDVALLDTAMAGMDGWGLLERLRQHPSTAGIPIAMMAGVLDSVDPLRIENAPIQGFLKKPVELRDLADRVRRLLDTPVPPPVPAPVPIPEPEPEPISAFATLPSARVEDLSAILARKTAEIADTKEVSDILELTEADLLLEDEPLVATNELLDAPIEEALDLEELDLEGLRGLPTPDIEVTNLLTPAMPVMAEEAFAELTPPEGYRVPDTHDEAKATLDLPMGVMPDVITSKPLVEEVDLPDLGPIDVEPSEILTLSDGAVPAEESLLVEEPLIDWMDESESMLPPVPMVEPTLELLPEPLEIHSERLDISSQHLEDPLDGIDETLSGVPGQRDYDAPTQTFLDLDEDTTPGLMELEFLPDSHPLESALTHEEPALAFVEPEAAAGEVPAVKTLLDIPVQAEPEIIEPKIIEAAAAELVPAEPVALAPSHPPASEAVPFVPALPAVSSSSAIPTPAQGGPGGEEYRAVLSLPRQELLEAILSDPALMDALCKAVVTRLGDHVLREVAWEVIPELAERIQNR